MRHLADIVSLLLLVVALALSLRWLSQTHDLEPLITSIGLVAAILTFFVDPWLDTRNRRKDILGAIVFETLLNIKLLTEQSYFDPNYDISQGVIIYPRLIFASMDAALSSGLFSDPKHHKLLNAIQNSRGAAEHLNNYLSIAEILSLFKDNDSRQQFQTALNTTDVFKSTMMKLQAMSKVIETDYV